MTLDDPLGLGGRVAGDVYTINDTAYIRTGAMSSTISFGRLRKWNLICGVAHLIQAIMMLAASQSIPNVRDFRKPLTTSFLVFNEDTKLLENRTKTIAHIHIGPLVSIFQFLSAAAHLIVWSSRYQPTYQKHISSGKNPARWYEYAVSSSLMIWLIAMLFGCYDLASLLLIVGCNVSMNLFGMLQEEINQFTGDRVLWAPFIYGCVSGLMPWVVVFMYFLGGGNFGRIPGFVYGVLFSYVFFFNTFPINMVLQYKRIGKWSDYRYGELWYMFLSLASKSLLAWIVFGGTQQPNDNNA